MPHPHGGIDYEHAASGQRVRAHALLEPRAAWICTLINVVVTVAGFALFILMDMTATQTRPKNWLRLILGTFFSCFWGFGGQPQATPRGPPTGQDPLTDVPAASAARRRVTTREPPPNTPLPLSAVV